LSSPEDPSAADARAADHRRVRAAIAGDARELRALLVRLTPVIQARVARVLIRFGRSRGRDARQEVEDLTQDVFVALFDREGRVLQSWDPARAMSLENFVGLVAEHRAINILKSGKRSPFTEDATSPESIDLAMGSHDQVERPVAARDVLSKVIERLRAELTPKGFMVFRLLVIEQKEPQEVCAQLGMTIDAVYAWRSRLAARIREHSVELEAVHRPEAPAAAGAKELVKS
jgi:RNA polymerase sigma-70 factor (ECF subfamily)